MKTQQTPTLYTMPTPEVLSAEAKAVSKGESVALVLCEMCGQPTAQWVVAQNAEVIQELNDEIIKRGKTIRYLTAEKATLETENERLNKELMHPDYNGDEDGFWWFVLHLLALIAVFALGCAVGGAV